MVARAIFHPGGTIAILIDNLRRHGVLEYVTTAMRGDVAKAPLRASYGFVFCDTLHDEREIDLYLPIINHILAPLAG